MRRIAYARISIRRKKELKYVIEDGFPEGCWNPLSQYSSSHSMGKSRSKLEVSLNRGKHRTRIKNVLLIVKATSSASLRADTSILT
jgi:hypothetical protein